MHKKDEQKRGYNQSQLLANELSKLMKIPCVNTLRKVKRTRPQHNLPAVQRRNNLNGAFRIIDKNIVKGKTILIIDDVISTGGSLLAMESLVEQAGGIVAGKIAVLAEGDAANRSDIKFLAPLPLFNADGTVKE